MNHLLGPLYFAGLLALLYGQSLVANLFALGQAHFYLGLTLLEIEL